ncbi:MAG: thymidine phosphorylase, partial [Xanthomonadales bacterium]|nr:thymidine phosphorylase [Gammaproteobacteria bacterium]NNK38105.1 thymidine phosphorylase [Xanthomonadales bacterium]
MQLAEEIILKKRDGGTLEAGDIRAFVRGITSGDVSDAQIAAFAMATWFRGMSIEEQMALTLAMRDSGDVMAWPDLDGPVLDKHSTG